ncbi:MAG: chemotaxis protein CheW [Defluviitaleaceae bacterium]|nr:chemotaxis protein CheW [Defluviitaleaceae bacterium]
METESIKLNHIGSDTMDDKYLIFKVEEEEFGIEISTVQEIINIVPITRVPHTPNYLKGIINLRGDLVPIIEVRSRFMMEHRPYDDLTCIIVLEREEEKIGLIVDEVHEVKYISKENTSYPPSAKLSYANQFVKGLGHVEEKVILLIEPHDLLHDD